MANHDSASTSIERRIGNSNPTDVGRGIIRLSQSDATLLGVQFGELLEIKSHTGEIAYAKCFYTHPSDETSLAGKAQVDNLTLRSIGIRTERIMDRYSIQISPGPKTTLATSVTLDQVVGEDGMLPDSKKVDTHWLSVMLEDRPLWKGAIFLIPVEGKMSLYRVTSVEPPVAIGTMLTKIAIAGDDSTKSESAITSKLFALRITVRFKKQAPDYETLAEILTTKKGFTRPPSKGRSVGMIVAARSDPDLMRLPQPDSFTPRPPIQFGRIQVYSYLPHEAVARTLTIGHNHAGNSFDDTDQLMRDLERGIPLIQEALVDDLHVDLMEDVESIELDATYRIQSGRDSRPVLNALDRLPDVLELSTLSGRKDINGGITLYPLMGRSDRSLSPKGLLEISIRSENVLNMNAGYHMSFRYGLFDLTSGIRLVLLSNGKAASIIKILEDSVKI